MRVVLTPEGMYQSTLEKNLHPARRALKSWMEGSGYRSISVTAFSLLKSPQTLHLPFGFFTAWIGDAHFTGL